MKRALDLGFPLQLIRKMLPLAAAAAAEDWARSFLSLWRGLDDLKKLRLGVILLGLRDPGANQVARRGIRYEHHAPLLVTGYSRAASSEILDFKGELLHGSVMLARSVEVKDCIKLSA
jgi:hypothetical protein